MKEDEIFEDLIEAAGQLDVVIDGLANIYGLEEGKMHKLLEACNGILTGIQDVIKQTVMYIKPELFPPREEECKVIPFPGPKEGPIQ